MKVISLSEEIERLEKKDFSIKNNKPILKTWKSLKISKKNILNSVILSKKLTNSNINTANISVSKTETISTTNSVERKTYCNLPQVRKVAIAKRRTKAIMLVALFISCFSLSVFIGFIGPFLLFK